MKTKFWLVESALFQVLSHISNSSLLISFSVLSSKMPPFQHLVQLCLFRRQYLQRLSPSQLIYPDINILRQGSAQEWLYKNVFSYSTSSNDDANERVILSKGGGLADKGYVCQRSFAPPVRYQLQVLKEMVGKIERSIRIWGTDDDVRSLFVSSLYPNDRDHYTMSNQA